MSTCSAEDGASCVAVLRRVMAIEGKHLGSYLAAETGKDAENLETFLDIAVMQRHGSAKTGVQRNQFLAVAGDLVEIGLPGHAVAMCRFLPTVKLGRRDFDLSHWPGNPAMTHRQHSRITGMSVTGLSWSTSGVTTERNPIDLSLPGGQGASCRHCRFGGVNWPNGCPSQHRHTLAGSTLIEQGKLPTGVVLLKDGLVGLSTVDSSGDEVGCTVRGPGALLGLEAIFAVPSSYRVWALTDLHYCEAPLLRLLPWIGSLETPLGAVMRLGFEEVNRRATERLELGGSSVKRVARLLLRRSSELHCNRVELTQRMVARMLSMTPETVSRALSRLQRAGAVVTTRPIRIGDPERLRQSAME